MTVLHDAYFRRSSEGYSLACPGESARPRVLVSFRADLAFAVSCLVSCAPLPGNDVSFLLTLPCAASPCFASRHGTSRSGMSGMSRPATVPNAAPVFGRSRSSGLSSGRLHSRCLRTSQMCRCVHPRGRAFAVSVWCAVRLEAGYRTELPACPTLPFPFCGRCVGGRRSGCSGQPPPHFRSRSVGGAWGGRLPGGVGSLSALPFVSQPRRALRGAAKTRAARTPKLG